MDSEALAGYLSLISIADWTKIKAIMELKWTKTFKTEKKSHDTANEHYNRHELHIGNT
jgi:hypothetical protein